MSIMFNEICINEEMLPKYTYIYVNVYTSAIAVSVKFVYFLKTPQIRSLKSHSLEINHILVKCGSSQMTSLLLLS